MSQNFDLAAKYKMDVQLISATLSDNVATTLPLSGTLLKRPFAVFLVDAVFGKTSGIEDYQVALSWTLDATLKPVVTPQFSNDVQNVVCQLAVCYKI